MRRPEHLLRTWSNPFRLKVFGAFATVVALAAVVTAVSLAEPTTGVSRRADTLAKPTIHPALAPATALDGIDRPVTVVGIGDSVTAGSNCDCESFVGLYAADLASQRGVKTTSINSGRDGMTSSQLLESLTHPGELRDQVAKADIVLVTIGANDLTPLESQDFSGCGTTCFLPMVENVGHNVELIVAAAREAHPDHPPTVLVTNYWNVFQDGEVGAANGETYQHWSDLLTRAEDSKICEGAERGGATCVDLYAPFKADGSKDPTPLLAPDGDHPDAAGHQVIASALLAKTPEPVPSTRAGAGSFAVRACVTRCP
jgi:lysophospholipase L1-like esterase